MHADSMFALVGDVVPVTFSVGVTHVRTSSSRTFAFPRRQAAVQPISHTQAEGEGVFEGEINYNFIEKTMSTTTSRIHK
jgi:hypothetical protein